MKEGFLTCTKPQATLLAFEGPVVEITRVESLLARLQQWNCGHNLKATADPNSELKGRIGDMTILFLVEKEGKFDFYSLRLEFVYRGIEQNPNFAVMQKLDLETSSSIGFEHKGTYYHSIYIESAKEGFVKIHFDHISLRGYTDQTCTYGGLYIVKVYTSYVRYVGGMCSHKAAIRFQRLYAKQGLTLNDRVMIYIKQYHLLFLPNLKLRFSLDQCLGLDNIYTNQLPGLYFPDGKGLVEFIRELI